MGKAYMGHRGAALPFLTVLAPSQKYHHQIGKKHKTLSDWARQIACLLQRWLPDFHLIITADGTYSVMELLAATADKVCWISRFRMDAALYDFPPPRRKGQMGRTPIKGKRQPSLEKRLDDPNTDWQQVCFSQWYGEEQKLMEITSGTALWYRAGKPIVPLRWVLVRDPENKHRPIAIQSTDGCLSPAQIVQHFVKRWQVEVTLEEVRAHLGVETQRQWSTMSIARTTPVLMALFSIITLWASELFDRQKLAIFQTAWYQKPYPTFSDAIASVRYRIWRFQLGGTPLFSRSAENPDREKTYQSLMNHLAFMAARAA